MQKSRWNHGPLCTTAALAIVLASCEGGALELVRDIEAARGDCGAAELRRSDESCIRMMEEYAGMSTELVHTYLGGLRALDQALERMPAPLFDTVGFGRAVSPELLPTVRPGEQPSGLRPVPPLPSSAASRLDSPMGGTFLRRGEEDRTATSLPPSGSRGYRNPAQPSGGGWTAPFGYGRDQWGIIPLDPYGLGRSRRDSGGYQAYRALRPRAPLGGGYAYGFSPDWRGFGDRDYRPGIRDYPSRGNRRLGGSGYGYGLYDGWGAEYRYDAYPGLGYGPYAGYGADPYDSYRYGNSGGLGYGYGSVRGYDDRSYPYGRGYDRYGYSGNPGYGYGSIRGYDDRSYPYGRAFDGYGYDGLGGPPYYGGYAPGASGYYPRDRDTYSAYGTRGGYGGYYDPALSAGYGAYTDDYDIRTPAEEWGYQGGEADSPDAGIPAPSAGPPRHAPGVLPPPGERLRRPWLND